MMRTNVRPRLKVVLADDQPVVRLGIRAILSREGGFDVVGDASSWEELIFLSDTCSPHLVITELRLHKTDVVDAIKELRRRRPDIRVLAFTSLVDESVFLRAIDAGVNGYLLKRAHAAELAETIRNVAQGGTVIDPVIAGRILEIVRQRQPVEYLVNEAPRLSPRDSALLGLLAEGRSNREIALELHLAEQTVKNYVSHVLHRLGISKRVLVMPYLEQPPTVPLAIRGLDSFTFGPRAGRANSALLT